MQSSYASVIYIGSTAHNRPKGYILVFFQVWYHHMTSFTEVLTLIYPVHVRL